MLSPGLKSFPHPKGLKPTLCTSQGRGPPQSTMPYIKHFGASLSHSTLSQMSRAPETALSTIISGFADNIMLLKSALRCAAFVKSKTLARAFALHCTDSAMPEAIRATDLDLYTEWIRCLQSTSRRPQIIQAITDSIHRDQLL